LDGEEMTDGWLKDTNLMSSADVPRSWKILLPQSRPMPNSYLLPVVGECIGVHGWVLGVTKSLPFNSCRGVSIEPMLVS